MTIPSARCQACLKESSEKLLHALLITETSDAFFRGLLKNIPFVGQFQQKYSGGGNPSEAVKKSRNPETGREDVGKNVERLPFSVLLQGLKTPQNRKLRMTHNDEI